jgi:hypothetical protein
MHSLPELKAEILRLTREYSALAHRANRPANTTGERPAFVPGKTTVPYAGRVFDADEVEAAVSATLDFWLTLGPEGDAMEKELAAYLGVRRSILPCPWRKLAPWASITCSKSPNADPTLSSASKALPLLLPPPDRTYLRRRLARGATYPHNPLILRTT